MKNKESEGFRALGDISLWQWILILILVWCVMSCSANYNLKRMKYHERMAIAKGAVIIHDTVFVEKVVTVPEVKTDTVFESIEGDTVFISKDRLKIKYINLPGDSVFIQGKCESDTVIIKVPVTITKEITAPKGFKDYLPWILVVLTIGAATYFLRSFKK
jgi:hypothetical protein